MYWGIDGVRSLLGYRDTVASLIASGKQNYIRCNTDEFWGESIVLRYGKALGRMDPYLFEMDCHPQSRLSLAAFKEFGTISQSSRNRDVFRLLIRVERVTFKDVKFLMAAYPYFAQCMYLHGTKNYPRFLRESSCTGSLWCISPPYEVNKDYQRDLARYIISVEDLDRFFDRHAWDSYTLKSLAVTLVELSFWPGLVERGRPLVRKCLSLLRPTEYEARSMLLRCVIRRARDHAHLFHNAQRCWDQIVEVFLPHSTYYLKDLSLMLADLRSVRAASSDFIFVAACGEFMNTVLKEYYT